MSVNRQALIVLGMHRSGTSALAGMLANLGAQMPKTTMALQRDNPRGFFESAALAKLHDQLLLSAASCWHDWSKFDPGWLKSGAAAQFREQLGLVIDQEYGDASLILIKDPRICRFLPFWLDACESFGIEPLVVFAWRDPFQVAHSLHNRNQFSRYKGLLLWLRHVLDAERDSRGLQRCFVCYKQLLSDWRACADVISSALSLDWNDRTLESSIEIDHLISRDLQHAGKGTTTPENMSGWVTEALSALEGLTQAPNQPQWQARLDAIRIEFEPATKFYATLVRDETQQTEFELAALQQRFGQQAARLAETVQNFQQSRAQLQACQGRISGLEFALSKQTDT